MTRPGPGSERSIDAVIGRFAPSPTGALHVGNLRTALVSWLAAKATGGRWIVRLEDLDRVTASEAHARSQLADLAAIGLVSDTDVVVQSQRFDRYVAALARLDAAGLLYPCFCTRREIREAASAPHGEGPEGAYPGTCRSLTEAERARREADGRRPAWRFRSTGERLQFVDLLAGPYGAVVDDVVVRRNDGVPAYNLAVVVDDAAQGVTQVVRGDDLLGSTPRQLALARCLELPEPSHLHVPLVLAPDGTRLAKRHGAVTLGDLRALGHDAVAVRSWLAAGLGLAAAGERPPPEVLIARFQIEALPRLPWRLTEADLAGRGSIGDHD